MIRAALSRGICCVVAAHVCAGPINAFPAANAAPPDRGGADGSDVGLYRERLPRAGAITDGTSALEFGDDPADFTVHAPAGWVLDRRSGGGQGLRAVFYPTGGSWVKSQAVMYVKTVIRRDKESIGSFIGRETKDFVSTSKSKVSPRAPINTGAGKPAQVRYFSGGNGANFESTAYVQEPSAFILIVLSAQTMKAHESSRAAFVELVRSYQLVAAVTKPRAEGAHR